MNLKKPWQDAGAFSRLSFPCFPAAPFSLRNASPLSALAYIECRQNGFFPLQDRYIFKSSKTGCLAIKRKNEIGGKPNA
ncbi:hypothetical protein [Acinetobacter sp. WCHAc010034]|uniref:hypothetical protein n=1 Tax=Acinetobacter sp. WCHAc010034 TaxID=1879049 RepID=UPI0013C31787|nr:hypothetical protein [Acinetobacter sp. WCHAc010034]